jgi:hypothetical protein
MHTQYFTSLVVLLQRLFDAAIERASHGEEGGCGHQWYVYSYQAGYLLRRGAFILEKLGGHLAIIFCIVSHMRSTGIILCHAYVQPHNFREAASKSMRRSSHRKWIPHPASTVRLSC